jgi:hypothetical protein
MFIKAVGTSFTETFAANDWKSFQSCFEAALYNFSILLSDILILSIFVVLSTFVIMPKIQSSSRIGSTLQFPYMLRKTRIVGV